MAAMLKADGRVLGAASECCEEEDRHSEVSHPGNNSGSNASPHEGGIYGAAQPSAMSNID